MSHRKKNRNDLSRFLKYTGDDMKGKERNSFERELQRDSFEAEAAEGLSMVTPEEAKKDLGEIRRRILSGKRRHRILSPIRIAAVLALLIGTTALLLILRRNPEPPLVSQVIEPKKTIAVPEAKPVTKTDVEKTISEASGTGLQSVNRQAQIVVADTLQDSLDRSPLEPSAIAEKSVTENTTTVGISKNEDVNKMLEGKMAGLEIRNSNRKARETMTNGEVISGKRVISGTIISTDDKEPLPGASVTIKGTTRGVTTDINGKFSIDAGTDSSLILVANFIGMERQEIESKPDTNLLIAMNSDSRALEEVVVVGYGIAKKQDATGSVATVNVNENSGEYNPPEPSVGYNEFNKYIETNIHYPAGIENKTREVVVLGVTVLANGNLSNIRVIKSPSQAFSDEALKLVKEGPAWKPATMNGLPHDEEIRVRIVFKP